MVSNTALGALAFLGAEATGVTNFTSIGGGSDSDRGKGRSGGSPGIPPQVAAMLSSRGGANMPDIEIPGNNGISPGTAMALTNQGSKVKESVKQVPVKIPTQIPGSNRRGGSGGSGVPFLDRNSGGSGGGNGSNRDSSGGGLTDRQKGAAMSGRDPFGLQATDSGWLGKGAEVLRATGSTTDQATTETTDFAKENPYFVGGTTTGAAAGSIIPGGGTAAGAATGAAAGGLAEITADTVTGGTPMGVQSPINNDDDNAVWDGPDPLNLGGNKDKPERSEEKEARRKGRNGSNIDPMNTPDKVEEKQRKEQIKKMRENSFKVL